MATSRENAGIPQKFATRDRLGKNRFGNGLSWRFPQKTRESRQNRPPSTRLGKIPAEPVYHGDRETKHDRISETIWIGETVRDRPCRRSDRREETPNSWFALPQSRRGEEFLKRGLLGRSARTGIPLGGKRLRVVASSPFVVHVCLKPFVTGGEQKTKILRSGHPNLLVGEVEVPSLARAAGK